MQTCMSLHVGGFPHEPLTFSQSVMSEHSSAHQVQPLLHQIPAGNGFGRAISAETPRAITRMARLRNETDCMEHLRDSGVGMGSYPMPRTSWRSSPAEESRDPLGEGR